MKVRRSNLLFFIFSLLSPSLSLWLYPISEKSESDDLGNKHDIQPKGKCAGVIEPSEQKGRRGLERSFGSGLEEWTMMELFSVRSPLW